MRLWLYYNKVIQIIKPRARASGKAAKMLALSVAEHQEVVKIIITGNGHLTHQDFSYTTKKHSTLERGTDHAAGKAEQFDGSSCSQQCTDSLDLKEVANDILSGYEVVFWMYRIMDGMPTFHY